MDFKPGQGVIFCDRSNNFYSMGVLDCFRQIRMNDLLKMKVGDTTWIHFPETHQFANLYGFLFVVNNGLVLSEGYSNHLRWQVDSDLSGKCPIYSGDFTKANVYKLRAPKTLQKLITKNSDLLWPRQV